MSGSRIFKSTFRKWLIPYLILVLIPIGFGVILYRQAVRTVERDVELIQEQSLVQIREQMDNMTNSLEILGYSISYGAEASELKECRDGSYSVRQIGSSKSLLDELRIYQAAYEAVSKIMVYFPKTGYMLQENRFCPLEWAKELLPEEYGLSVSGLAQLAENGSGGILTAGEQGQLPLYLYRPELGKKPEAVVLFLLDVQYLKKLLDLTNSHVYLRFRDGATFLRPELPGVFQEGGGDVLAGSSYYRMSVPCGRNGMELVNLLPSREYRKTVRRMNGFLSAYLVVCLVLGVGGVWWRTKKNYLPVKRLREMTGKIPRGTQEPEFMPDGKKRRKPYDDLDLVQAAYENLFRAYEEGKNHLRRVRDDERNGKMNRLLKRKPGLKGNKAPDGWGKLCPDPFFVLMSVDILDFAEFTDSGGVLTSEMMETAYFAVGNVLEELLEGGHFAHIGAETDGLLYFLINVPKQKENMVISELERVSERLAHFLSYPLQMPVSVNISAVHKGWDEVRQCYQEIEEVKEYRSFRSLSEKETVCFDDVIRERANEAGRCEPNSARRAPEDRRGEAFDSEKTAAVDEQEDRMDAVAAYINSHYTDNSLTVGFLAERFGIGLSWLSRSFKSRNGAGILEYINRLRLGEAKRLIQEGRPVKEVAVRVGFSDTQPLNRMFRQMEGMTPTEYRNRLEEEAGK